MDTKHRVKTFITAAVMAAAPLTMSIPSASAEEYVVENSQVLTLFGDVNFDGTIGVSDGVQLTRFILGQTDKLGNIKNADLLADGKIDVFDMVYLRKMLTGDSVPKGTKMTVKVVDMMTGEPLENADITLSEMNGNNLYDIGNRISTYGEEITYLGLPDDKDYQYLIFVENLPEGYDTAYKTWDQVLEFDVEAGTPEKEVVIRVAADDAEPNIKFTHMDWCQGIEHIGYDNLFITDKEGNYYYQRQYSGEMALPDGDYHAEFNPFDYPVSLVDPDSDFAAMIKKNYPDAVIEDFSGGIDFSVVNGKPDRDLVLSFGPKEGKSNTIGVNCYNSLTGEPVEGVELSLIEAPNSYAKKVSWVSDGTAKVFDNLWRTGSNSYKVVVDSVPAGYTVNKEEQSVGWGYVYDYSTSFDFYLMPDDSDKELSFSVLTFPDMQPYTGSNTYAVLNADFETLLPSVKPGEKFALADGNYLICPKKYPDDEPYEGIWFDTDLGRELTAETGSGTDEFKSDILKFTVKDGKTDKDIVLYVGDRDEAVVKDEEEIKEIKE